MAAMAIILNNEKNVQHSIVNGLDSNDHAEQQAAIHAAKKFTNWNRFVKTFNIV